ncbi:MAG: hypothetical protein ACREK2_02205 [Gemmatimonadota bacterium]
MIETTFFTDNDLAPHAETEVARILRAAGLNIICHADRFPPGTEDQVWLGECGRNGWIALSRDRQIRYTPLAKERIMSAGVRLFLLIGRHPHARLAQNFVNTLQQVHDCIRRNEEGFIARVYMAPEADFLRSRPGRVKEWLTRAEWLQGR